MKIFVSMPEGDIRNSFIKAKTWERLRKIADLDYNRTSQQLTKEALTEKIKDADALITGWEQPLITSDMVGNVKIIAHTGGTVGGIIDASVFDIGVKVISGNRYYAESVAEGVLAYMLFELRKMGYYSGNLKNGNWLDNYTEGLFDQTVGIVSLGAIAKRVIELLKPFRVKIKVYSTHQSPELAGQMGFTYASLEEIFSTCKIVSVHTAKNPDTNSMINEKHFKQLQDNSIFINTARASVINEDDLIKELKTGRFRALLDVFNYEPLPKDSELLKLDNVTLFPHQAGPTFDRRDIITNFLIDDIERFFKGGQMKNEITREVAERMTRN